ncbi:CAP-associated domain-containing protein [Acidaminobacter sp.]|uniref:CAP-associated domain-containing protein n=1 Tax=Acidaminobacter sp. TaxID=1872102 RepID=UPI002567A219|nr:CAP-associated domain-containing protein [Acidaminobacter sp.]MDK9711260.1 CAP-associated domain-containing protein [Acidaminobacter sp.]
MRKLGRLLLTLVLMVSLVAPVAFAFEDTDQHWGRDYIGTLVKYGIVNGYPDGSFRPDAQITRSEFLVMTLKSLGETVRTASSGEYWGQPYIDKAKALGLIQSSDFASLTASTFDRPILREEMAGIVSAAYLRSNERPTASTLDIAADKISDLDAVRDCYQEPTLVAYAVKLLSGYTDGSFRPAGTATRAESSVVSAKLLADRLNLGDIVVSTPPVSSPTFKVAGISIGDSLEKVTQTLGTPVRKDLSEYGFEWYVYHKTYKDYVMIGISSGKVVGLFTHYGPFESAIGLRMGSTRSDVQSKYGAGLTKINKGTFTFLIQTSEEFDTYKLQAGYATFFYDLADSKKVMAFQLIAPVTEEAFKSLYPTASAGLRTAYEKQTFDLVNVFRIAKGKSVVTYNATASKVAYAHSLDMLNRSFFDHVNPDGKSPFDRMQAAGLSFSAASENIAAGYINAVTTHMGWVNSPGHRVNLLGNYTQLGTGVAFGGEYKQYFTQNFLTPR